MKIVTAAIIAITLHHETPVTEPTHYQVLQVNPSASLEVIEAAYQRLAKMYHPDVNKSPNTEQKMKQIDVAYQVLRDSVTRWQYDGTLKWNFTQAMQRGEKGRGGCARREVPQCGLRREVAYTRGLSAALVVGHRKVINRLVAACHFPCLRIAGLPEVCATWSMLASRVSHLLSTGWPYCVTTEVAACLATLG